MKGNTNMCMITYLAPDVEVPEREIINGATWNDDGHGWAVAAETGVMLTGRYMDADTALTTFIATRKAFPHAPAMFHSRFATHGTVGLPNVHPFTVGKFAAVAHNGILPTKFQPQKNGAMSDTAIMARYWLAGRAQVSGIWTRKERRRIGNIIGRGNKLCILSVSPFLPEPRAYLVNASQGYFDTATGAWFSATDYQHGWSYKGKGTLGTGNWWNSPADGVWDGDEWIGTKPTSSDKPVCPNCATSAEIDKAAGVCLYCDWCLDCQYSLGECQCYYAPGMLLSAEEAHEQREQARTLEEIEVQISELDNGDRTMKFSTPNGGKRS